MKVSLYSVEPTLLNKVQDNKAKDKLSPIESFGQVMQQKLKEVNELQIKADKLTEQYLAGESVELHDVMLAAQEAQLALQLTVQIRNKLVEAYQEVSRMQI